MKQGILAVTKMPALVLITSDLKIMFYSFENQVQYLPLGV